MLHMAPDGGPSDNSNPESSGKLRFGLDLKRSSKQNSRKLREKAIAGQGKKSVRLPVESRSKTCVTQSFADRSSELMLGANDGISVHTKTSGTQNHHKVVRMKGTKEDELVKYMLDLPGYLQQIGGGENSQGKALNVGVLDWSQLENWSGNRKCTGMGGGNNKGSLATNSLLGTVNMSMPTSSNAVDSESSAHVRDQPPSLSILNSSHRSRISRDAKPPANNSLRFHDLETTNKNGVGGHERGPWTYKSFGRNTSDAVLEKVKKKELDQKANSKGGNSYPNTKCNDISMRPKEHSNACKGEAKVRVQEKQVSDRKRTSLDRNIPSGAGASSSKMIINHRVLHNSEQRENVGDDERKDGVEELQESGVLLSPQHQAANHDNIVLLQPRKVSQNISPASSRTSLEKNLTRPDENSWSGPFSHEKEHPSQVLSEVPHSCPLPSGYDASSESHKTLSVEIKTDGAVQLSDAPDKLAGFHRIASDATDYTRNSNKGVKGDAKTREVFDQETARKAAIKSRHPSPNHRFSFSLSRMTRTFSSKESSAVSESELSCSWHSSAVSGPLMSKPSSHLDDSHRESASCHKRSRSSPFRRLLDPLLKPRGPTPPQSSQSVQPVTGSLSSLSFQAVSSIESATNGKNETFRKRALVQVTVKNGLPLFRLTVDNNSSILAAPMKNLSPHGKSDSSCNYTFYSVDEIKKRSGSWMNQGSKVKNCGFAYNVVGQMKVSSSSFFDMTGKNFISRSRVTETVLFGAELRQGDKAPPKIMPNRELAAIVVKTPCENISLDTKQSDKDAGLMETIGSQCVLENELSNSVTVILPVGIHGLPREGLPSLLIHRWKSGGSCDCGGWDVGCNLRVLSIESQCSDMPTKSKCSPTLDCLELFVQGEPKQDKPVFCLAPLEKEAFSIEFSPEISLLQAFFTSITLLSCQKSSDLTSSNLTEDKTFQESRFSSGRTKNEPIFPRGGKAHVKYTSKAPLSPVGRA